MKKSLVRRVTISGATERANKKYGGNFLSRMAGTLGAALVGALILTSGAMAQSTQSPDLSDQFREDKIDLQHSKTLVREVREEKQQLKALNNIPQSIMDRFNASFPGAQDIAWSVPANYVQVNFTLDGKSKAAYYDYDNHLIGTSHYLDYSLLPAKARERIANDYKGYTPVKTMFYDDNEDNDLDMVLFDMPLAKDSYFVQLTNGEKQIVLQVDTDGEVSYFSDLR